MHYLRGLVFVCFFFFFFNDTATTEIYTLSLHDALPIWSPWPSRRATCGCSGTPGRRDRKSTRLNSSHQIISYAVFCLKKKKQTLTLSTNNRKIKYIKTKKLTYTMK